LAHHSKKYETVEVPQNRRFYFEVKSWSPLLASANSPCKEHLFNWGYLFCFILISWGCLTSPTFFFVAMSQFDWPITKKKKVETMEATQNRRFQKSLAWANTYPHYKLGLLLYLFIYLFIHKCILAIMCLAQGTKAAKKEKKEKEKEKRAGLN